VFVGSEGTLGIATKITLRIVKRPECIQTLLAAFNSTGEAGAAVSGIIATGMLPAAIEMMDNLAIQAAEAAVHANYPDCGALLLVELDGPVAEVEELMRQVDEICRKCGAGEIRVAQTDAERAVVGKGRKAAFAAVGWIAGEGGVGEEEKMLMCKLYAEPDLQRMQRVRCVFDPVQLSNPTKVFPRTRLCGEKPGEYRAHPAELAGIAERF